MEYDFGIISKVHHDSGLFGAKQPLQNEQNLLAMVKLKLV
jgi:hypothetical protein